jgi:hypothetical protein
MRIEAAPPPPPSGLTRRRLPSLALAFVFVLGPLLLAAGGCAAPGRDAGAIVGKSSGAELLARYGQPVRIWAEADGGRTLEYSGQPFGHRTWMLRLGPDDRLIAAATDALSPAGLAAIKPGMRPEQVARRLGRERSRVFFPLSGEEVWDWNIEPDPSGYLLRFNVHFKDGVVLRTSRSMDDGHPRLRLPLFFKGRE